jgi:hypothetical protein
MTRLETILAEILIRDQFPCDLGDGIEVLHDVEDVEIEMECDVGDDPPARWFDEEFARTIKLAPADVAHRFLRDSTPYERIEIRFLS